jgi:hypothetical protein
MREGAKHSAVYLVASENAKLRRLPGRCREASSLLANALRTWATAESLR